MATNKYLMQLANEYLEKGQAKDFSREKLCEAVQYLVLGKEFCEFENGENLTEEEREEIYRELMEKNLAAKHNSFGSPRFTTPICKKTTGLLYVIHQKQYTTTDEFLDRIAEHENITAKTAKGKMLSKYWGNLFLGIGLLLRKYDKTEEWESRGVDNRVYILESIEEEVFLEIKDEYTRKGGCE